VLLLVLDWHRVLAIADLVPVAHHKRLAADGRPG
jgi:hypothetical protein